MVAQGLAVAIFVAMFVLIVMDKFGRQYITLGCVKNSVCGIILNTAGPSSKPANNAPTTCGIRARLVKSPKNFVHIKINAR